MLRRPECSRVLSSSDPSPAEPPRHPTLGADHEGFPPASQSPLLWEVYTEKAIAPHLKHGILRMECVYFNGRPHVHYAGLQNECWRRRLAGWPRRLSHDRIFGVLAFKYPLVNISSSGTSQRYFLEGLDCGSLPARRAYTYHHDHGNAMKSGSQIYNRDVYHRADS